MKLLIDHTSFHCIEKVLEGKVTEESELHNFLQICIQIIFSDEIFLSTVIPEDVIEKSKEILDLIPEFRNGLIKLGAANTPLKSMDMIEVCKKVSQDVENYLCLDFERYNITDNFMQYMPILSNNQLSQFKEVTEVIRTQDRKFIEETLRDISFAEKNDGLLAYILAINPDLCDMVFKNAADEGWNLNKTTRLISDVRTDLNMELAKFSGVVYSPSVQRAREKDMTFKAIERKVHDIGENYIRFTRQNSIDLPDFTEALVSLGKGNPKDILEQAFIFRDEFSVLRKKISSFQTCTATQCAIEMLNQEALILFRSKCPSFCLEKNRNPYPVFKTSKTDPFPISENIFPKRISDYYFFHKKEIQAFTEISSRLAQIDSHNHYWEILQRQASKNIKK
jgi:hypothetical protein